MISEVPLDEVFMMYPVTKQRLPPPTEDQYWKICWFRKSAFRHSDWFKPFMETALAQFGDNIDSFELNFERAGWIVCAIMPTCYLGSAIVIDSFQSWAVEEVMTHPEHTGKRVARSVVWEILSRATYPESKRVREQVRWVHLTCNRQAMGGKVFGLYHKLGFEPFELDVAR